MTGFVRQSFDRLDDQREKMLRTINFVQNSSQVKLVTLYFFPIACQRDPPTRSVMLHSAVASQCTSITSCSLSCRGIDALHECGNDFLIGNKLAAPRRMHNYVARGQWLSVSTGARACVSYSRSRRVA